MDVKNSIPGPVTHVIFDWAGTLYDDQYPSFLATQVVIKQLSGRNVTFEEYRAHFCLPVVPFYRRYGVQLPLSQINDIYFDHYADYCDKGRLYPGVRDTLHFLQKKGMAVSILSTMREQELQKLCRARRIAGCFTNIHGSVCDKRKELADHLAKVGAQASETLFVGDMDHDIEAANMHGLVSGCVLNGYQPTARLLEAGPKLVWATQKEWPAFFRGLK